MADLEVLLDGFHSDPITDDLPPENGRAALFLLVGIVALAVVALLFRAPSASDVERDSGQVGRAIVDAPIAPPSVSPAVAPQSPPTGNQLLGVQTGYEVWFGGDTPLARLDLDTGQLLVLDFRGFPILNTGNFLVTYRPDLRGFATVDRRLPEEESALFTDDPEFVVDMVAASSVEGTVWVVRQVDDGSYDWRLISLANQTVLRSATTMSLTMSSVAHGIAVAVGPELDERADGLYTLTEAGHERWLDGRVIVRDAETALIEECRGTSSCALTWYDLRTLEAISLTPPVDLLPVTELLGAGSWIYERTESTSESRFVEVAGSRRFDTMVRVPGRQFDVSSNGLWAAISSGQRLQMLDLSSGDRTLIREVTNRIGTSSSVVLAATTG